ncbi:MAG: hypothetical protein BJ554DRAFT_5581 [Olpidium bornovanus]|uniref:Uncharacterized protein n=1 Tax=Olpidium bornovanus TaxID=278681 RepID=A0A8H7ZZL4_9FUNG|nr:MAG: hypothetical protein BJ554DRAFT_5581 [Olpidium bornovanus]
MRPPTTADPGIRGRLQQRAAVRRSPSRAGDHRHQPERDCRPTAGGSPGQRRGEGVFDRRRQHSGI